MVGLASIMALAAVSRHANESQQDWHSLQRSMERARVTAAQHNNQRAAATIAASSNGVMSLAEPSFHTKQTARPPVKQTMRSTGKTMLKNGTQHWHESLTRSPVHHNTTSPRLATHRHRRPSMPPQQTASPPLASTPSPRRAMPIIVWIAFVSAVAIALAFEELFLSGRMVTMRVATAWLCCFTIFSAAVVLGIGWRDGSWGRLTSLIFLNAALSPDNLVVVQPPPLLRAPPPTHLPVRWAYPAQPSASSHDPFC